MNTDNLNKSQVIEMMLRIYDVRDHVLTDKTVYEMYHGEKAYLWNLLWKLNKLLHAFGHDYTLCAYCCNSIDHNLGDHKLAIERQKITNRQNYHLNLVSPSRLTELDFNDRMKRLESLK